MCIPYASCIYPYAVGRGARNTPSTVARQPSHHPAAYSNKHPKRTAHRWHYVSRDIRQDIVSNVTPYPYV